VKHSGDILQQERRMFQHGLRRPVYFAGGDVHLVVPDVAASLLRVLERTVGLSRDDAVLLEELESLNRAS
jgi:hypothetical protein